MSELDMDDIFLQCNKNAIYVLNTSYRYGELDMINLFGSPAGRAITELKSTKAFCTDGHPLLAVTKNQPHLDLTQQPQHHQVLPQNHLQKLQPHRSHSPPEPNHGKFGNSISMQQCQNDIKYSNPNVDKSKKGLIFKSNVASKKGKFWKFLEEDKNSQKSSLEDLSTTSNGRSRWRKQNQKSSTELYREAAQLLGLSCTLSDSCRCLDCQSRYFDCDDSDTFSDCSGDTDVVAAFNRQYMTAALECGNDDASIGSENGNKLPVSQPFFDASSSNGCVSQRSNHHQLPLADNVFNVVQHHLSIGESLSDLSDDSERSKTLR